MSDEELDELDEPRGLSGFQKVLLGAIVAVLALSVAARVLAGGGEPGPSTASTPPPGASGLVAPGAQTTSAPEGEEPGGLESLLPFLTEGSFFALIGFAVGYATRKAVKLLLILVALLFIGVQALAHAGIAEVDWGRALGALNDLVLNLKENQPFTEMLKDKVPTTGAFLAGVFLGFRRG